MMPTLDVDCGFNEVGITDALVVLDDGGCCEAVARADCCTGCSCCSCFRLCAACAACSLTDTHAWSLSNRCLIIIQFRVEKESAKIEYQSRRSPKSTHKMNHANIYINNMQSVK